MKLAKPSLSHRSSNHLMVTESPNHWCEVSWNRSSARARMSVSFGADGNSTASSRRKAAPACSMPPKANSGTSTRSYFGNGKGEAKYRSNQRTDSRLSRSTSGASVRARASCDLRTNRRVAPRLSVSSANGPAAKAKRYVLIGGVAANRNRRRLFETYSVAAIGAFSTAVHARGRTSSRLKRAFRSGWSKQGKALLAAEGTKSV